MTSLDRRSMTPHVVNSLNKEMQKIVVFCQRSKLRFLNAIPKQTLNNSTIMLKSSSISKPSKYNFMFNDSEENAFINHNRDWN